MDKFRDKPCFFGGNSCSSPVHYSNAFVYWFTRSACPTGILEKKVNVTDKQTVVDFFDAQPRDEKIWILAELSHQRFKYG